MKKIFNIMLLVTTVVCFYSCKKVDKFFLQEDIVGTKWEVSSATGQFTPFSSTAPFGYWATSPIDVGFKVEFTNTGKLKIAVSPGIKLEKYWEIYIEDDMCLLRIDDTEGAYKFKDFRYEVESLEKGKSMTLLLKEVYDQGYSFYNDSDIRYHLTSIN
jgi:hypothetical protein